MSEAPPIKITPTSDRLLVKKCFKPDGNEKKGALFLPDSYKDRTNICVVLAIGPDVKHFSKDDCLDWDKIEDAVYVQGPGGEVGISEHIQENPLTRGKKTEFFIRERGLLPACKFISEKSLTNAD